MNFYFSVGANHKIGLGNLSRCIKFAEYLAKKNNEVFFIFENKLEKKLNYKFPGKIVYLNSDLKKNFKNIKKEESILIIDNPKLKKKWFIYIKKFFYKTVIFDDYFKKNLNSDLTVSNNLKYTDGLIKVKNKYTKIAGPKFAIITNKNIKVKSLKNRKYITFYLGGSGNFNILKNLIIELIQNITDKKIIITVIVGPFAKNYDWLNNLSKNYKNLKIFYNPKNLMDIYNNTILFIGSAGSSLYELNYTNTFGIFFSNAKDQNDSIYNLKNLGHYLKLNKSDLNKIKLLVKLILCLVNNKRHIFNFQKIQRFKIDNKGPERIYKYIKLIANNKKINNSKIQNKLFDKYTIRKVDNSNINEYLKITNYKHNKKFSIGNKKVTKLNHYLWWFNNKRNSYILKKNSKIILIFYHEYKKIYNKKYIIAGWYSNQNISSYEILQGLDYQYNLLKNKGIWLSIIKKNNFFSIKINVRYNFKKVTKKSKLHSIIKKIYGVKKGYNYYFKSNK